VPDGRPPTSRRPLPLSSCVEYQDSGQLCVVVFFQANQSRDSSRAPGIRLITVVSFSVIHEDTVADHTRSLGCVPFPRST